MEKRDLDKGFDSRKMKEANLRLEGGGSKASTEVKGSWCIQPKERMQQGQVF